MPLILINRDINRLNDGQLISLGNELRRIVAEELSVEDEPDSHLTIDEIEVRVRNMNALDINPSPLGIEILANHYDGRAANLQERTERIVKRIRELDIIPKKLLGTKESFVWILLGHGGFAHF